MLSRFTEEKKLQVLRAKSSEGEIKRVCKKYRLSESTFYRWRARYVSKPLEPLLCVRFLHLENQRLKHRVAEVSLDYNILRSALISDRGSKC